MERPCPRGVHWNERSLTANSDPSVERCWLLFAHATLLADLGRDEEARAYLVKAEALTDMPQYAALRTHAMVASARCQDALGDPEAANRIRAEAIKAFSEMGDEHQLSRALNHSAMSMLLLGRAAEARDLAQRAVEMLGRMDSDRLPYAADTLAQAHAFLGELDQAKGRWIEVGELNLDQGWGIDVNVQDALFGLALVAGLRGKNQLALRLHYAAQRAMADGGGIYAEPISPKRLS